MLGLECMGCGGRKGRVGGLGVLALGGRGRWLRGVWSLSVARSCRGRACGCQGRVGGRRSRGCGFRGRECRVLGVGLSGSGNGW